MIEENGNASIEGKENVTDRAVLDFRKLVEGKKQETENEKEADPILRVCVPPWRWWWWDLLFLITGSARSGRQNKHRQRPVS